MRFTYAAARRLLVKLLLLWAASLAGAGGHPSASVTMSDEGHARTVIVLEEAFRGKDLSVSLLGWRQPDGSLQSELPPEFKVSFPSQLPASQTPVLPVMVRSDGPTRQITSLALEFVVRAGGEAHEVRLEVELPKLVILELDVPESVLAFRDRPTVVPVRILNHGNSAGRARLSFSGVAASAASVSVPPGGQTTVRIEIPPLTDGRRTVTITISGGLTPVTESLLVFSVGSGDHSRYGLLATLGVQTTASAGRQIEVAEPDFSFSVQGQLSRHTYLDARVAWQDMGAFPEPKLRVRYRGTTLEFDEVTESSPSGSVGRGLYLTQVFRNLPALGTVVLGASLPLGQEAATPRFGVRLDGPRLHTQVALNISAEQISGEARANFAPFHASLSYSELGPPAWRGSLHYSSRSLGAELSGELSQASTKAAFSSRYSLPSSASQTAGTFSVRLHLEDWAFSYGAVSAAFGSGTIEVSGTQAGMNVAGSRTFSLGPGSLTLNGDLPILGAGVAQAGATVSWPLGPVAIDASGHWAASGALEAGAGVNYTTALPRGTMTAEVTLQASSLLADPTIGGRISTAYADQSGLTATMGIQLPSSSEGDGSASLGLSYSSFLPTSRRLATFLDGPDPTARTVRVVSIPEGRPLSDVRLIGCGQAEVTSADGTAVLRGPAGACPVRVDPQSLPADAFVPDSEYPVAPGAMETIPIPSTSELLIEVRYRDARTGEVVETGPAHEVRVRVEGRVSRWTNTRLPAGSVRFSGLPAGTYKASVNGVGERLDVELETEPKTLLLTVPAPERSVLDPATVTPPVKLQLESFVVELGSPIGVTVSSSAAIARISVESGGESRLFESPSVPGEWHLAFPSSGLPAGPANLDLSIEFTSGQVAYRTVQVILTGEARPTARAMEEKQTAPPPEPGLPDVAEREEGATETRADREGDPSQGPLPVVPSREANPGLEQLPAYLSSLVELSGSDELLSFRAPSSTVPPGVMLAVYVSSAKEIASIEVTNLRHLDAAFHFRRAEAEFRWVLSISPLDPAETLDIPVEVTFTDGSVARRVVSFDVDRYAPVPLIPGYNVPLPPISR